MLPVILQYRFIDCLAIFLVIVLMTLNAGAQLRWDGGGGNEQWNNAGNWEGDRVPSTTDEVVLDNTFISSGYQVKLPSGMVAVTIRKITISPGSGHSIELALPADNTMVPGFVVAGTGYGLTINNGGVFRNASGAESGTPVDITDSIRINNGGRYVHNTPRGHSANMSLLSSAPGTEEGIMEFDVPDASTTISLSGRTYGKLVLNAVAAGGALTYTAAGTKRLVINSDLEIGPGVNFSLHFSDTIFVRRDLIQHGGTLNLGTSSRTVVMAVYRRLVQTQGAVLTETGLGKPAIVLCGNEEQQIDMKGSIQNDISWIMKGAGGGALLSPLSLPYRLELLMGKLSTSSAALLTLLPSCSLKADSLSSDSFINGPLKKEGLVEEDFLFPVGKADMMRWVMMKKASGAFTVEYHRQDPHALGFVESPGIDHLSSIEYWSVESSGGAFPASGQPAFSFSDTYSGGVTDLADLRVCMLVASAWQNAGNAGVTGTPGANGSIFSDPINEYPSVTAYFTLASASIENPLPLSLISFRVSRDQDKLTADWEVSEGPHDEIFELQASADNREFLSVQQIKADPGITRYRLSYTGRSSNRYYRLRIIGADGSFSLSKRVYLPSEPVNFRITLASNRVSEQVLLNVNAAKEQLIQIVLFNASGQALRKQSLYIPRGGSSASLSVDGFPAGWYHIVGLTPDARVYTLRFFKN